MAKEVPFVISLGILVRTEIKLKRIGRPTSPGSSEDFERFGFSTAQAHPRKILAVLWS
jgi:hypothetical protein